MAEGAIDPNAYTAPFQLTKGMHRDIYSTVDPKNPKLNVTGKVVVITGAGGGLGYNIAQAWSTAGAAGISLVGRSPETLQSTADSLKVPSLVAVGDVVDEKDAEQVIQKTITKFGRVDALVNAAGSFNQGAITGDIEPSQWFRDLEVNLKGTYNMCHYFIKAFNGKGTIINLVSLGASFLAPGISSYSISKLAVIKLGQHLDLEHPNLRVFAVHPGIVEAEAGRGAIVPMFNPFAKDKGYLTGGVTLYLQKPKADYLRGGFYSVNWNLDEMEVHKSEIAEKNLLKLAFLNAQLAPGGNKWSD